MFMIISILSTPHFSNQVAVPSRISMEDIVSEFCSDCYSHGDEIMASIYEIFGRNDQELFFDISAWPI